MVNALPQPRSHGLWMLPNRDIPEYNTFHRDVTYGHFFEELAIFKGLAIIYELRDNLTHKHALMVPSLLKRNNLQKTGPFCLNFSDSTKQT